MLEAHAHSVHALMRTEMHAYANLRMRVLVQLVGLTLQRQIKLVLSIRNRLTAAAWPPSNETAGVSMEPTIDDCTYIVGDCKHCIDMSTALCIYSSGTNSV